MDLKTNLLRFGMILNMNKANDIFIRIITDNKGFLQKCLNLDQELKDALFGAGSIAEGMYFVNFLQVHYTNDEIIGFWKSIERIGPGLTESGMDFFRALDKKLLFDNFKKVENNFIDLFSEFVRLKTMEKEWQKDNPLNFSCYPINNPDYTSEHNK